MEEMLKLAQVWVTGHSHCRMTKMFRLTCCVWSSDIQVKRKQLFVASNKTAVEACRFLWALVLCTDAPSTINMLSSSVLSFLPNYFCYNSVLLISKCHPLFTLNTKRKWGGTWVLSMPCFGSSLCYTYLQPVSNIWTWFSLRLPVVLLFYLLQMQLRFQFNAHLSRLLYYFIHSNILYTLRFVLYMISCFITWPIFKKNP